MATIVLRVRLVGGDHTDVTYDERIVDAACMHLVMRPEIFDVLLLPNLYGDIVSDLCAGLVGGLGVVPGANLGLDAAGRYTLYAGSGGAQRIKDDLASTLGVPGSAVRVVALETSKARAKALYPDIADKNLANPTALLLSGLMMLDHIGERQASERIRTALTRVLAAGAVRTHDLGGTASTTEFTDAICREIEK